MANRRIYLRCKCGPDGVAIAKWYPGHPYFVGLPTPRGMTENSMDEINDGMRALEYTTRIDEFLSRHEEGSHEFFIEYDPPKS